MDLHAKKRYRELIKLAKENHIGLDHNCPKSIISMTVRRGSLCVISLPPEDVDPNGPVIGPTVLECFAHEMGHCITDSFYKPFVPLEERIGAEEKANIWAVNFLMPLRDVLLFLSNEKEIKQKIAKHYNVGEEFVETACRCYAKEKNDEKHN